MVWRVQVVGRRYLPLLPREYDRELIHLLSLQGEIAKEVADEIHLTLDDHNRLEPG